MRPSLPSEVLFLRDAVVVLVGSTLVVVYEVWNDSTVASGCSGGGVDEDDLR